MSLNRNLFLESLIKESRSLGVIFLNHSGSPASMLSDLGAIDILADKPVLKKFRDYCIAHPLVSELIIFSSYEGNKLVVAFADGSELRFRALRNIVRKSMLCLPVKDIRSAAVVNDFGMYVPSFQHQFEYLVIENQLAVTTFPDKFQKYFSALETPVRTAIFRYLQTKYNLVFNTLEDLYKPRGTYNLKIVIGLRKLNENTLLKMTLRSVGVGLIKFFRLFSKSEQRILSNPSNKNTTSDPVNNRPAGQLVL